MGAPDQIRVLVADDHDRVRRALVDMLAARADIEVVGFAADGAQAVSLATALAPDVVVIDIGMPALDGIQATRLIATANPRVRIVVLTAYRGRQDEAYRAGASAHLLKDSHPDELIRCIRAAAAGRNPGLA